jgi:hypothetical protein
MFPGELFELGLTADRDVLDAEQLFKFNQNITQYQAARFFFYLGA